MEFAKASPSRWQNVLAEMKFKYFDWVHQHCDFILCLEYLHITGESCLDLGLNLSCEILRFLKWKKRESRAWLKGSGSVVRGPCGSPVSCSASAQVGVTESCLGDRTSLLETGVFYPPECIIILHLSPRAAWSPSPLPCMVFVLGFLKRPSFQCKELAEWPSAERGGDWSSIQLVAGHECRSPGLSFGSGLV